ncbi:MAG: ABC transporter permease [Polyangiaceae bacterium]
MVPVKYNLRNLVVRKTTSIAAGLGLGLVVFVFASVLMLSNGVQKTLGRSAEPNVAVVLRKGSDAELASGLEEAQIGVMIANPAVAKSQGGLPLASAELVVIILLDKLGTDGVSNVQVRGVPDNIYELRKDIRFVEGRAAKPGTDEVVVGKAIAGRFKGLALGQSFELRKNRPVTVVGVFEDKGSSFESEVWGDVKTVAAAFGREGYVSSLKVRLTSAPKFDGFKASLEQNPQLQVDVLRESEYYEKQSEGTSIFINAMGIVIAVFFSIGASIGAMITMYASIANRQREIATLRALGFTRFSILFSFLMESVFLALAGGTIGVLASLGMSFVKFSTVNFASFSEITFSFEPTPKILGIALGVAVGMGLAGGLFPAIRAARMNLVQAIRGG